jgi:hypothetical protein
MRGTKMGDRREVWVHGTVTWHEEGGTKGNEDEMIGEGQKMLALWGYDCTKYEAPRATKERLEKTEATAAQLPNSC